MFSSLEYMNTYELRTKEFAGPMDKLLELIEGKKLEIAKISLAEVTADFIGYVNSLSGSDPKILADFVAVAAKLILIKSHTLLPSLQISKEEENDIKDLENRLRLYKQFKEAERNIKKLWAKKISYARDFLMDVPTGFYFSQKITPADLRSIIEGICAEIALIAPKIGNGEIRLINFEEKMRELLARVTALSETSFAEVSKGKGKAEMVVIFLAILHLLKDSLVKVSQTGEFGDIRIEKA